MDIFNKIQHDLSEGISVLRREGTSVFIKTMAEVDVLKSKFDLYRIHGNLAALYKELGERFIGAVERRDYNFLQSEEVKELLENIESMRVEEEMQKREVEGLKSMNKE
ncbi:MAG: hypothetical protein PH343_02620 [Nitrospira sp.]|nr:hypothetical protein [Nitrospira sp.]